MADSVYEGNARMKIKRGSYKRYTHYRSHSKIPSSTKRFWRSRKNRPRNIRKTGTVTRTAARDVQESNDQSTGASSYGADELIQSIETDLISSAQNISNAGSEENNAMDLLEQSSSPLRASSGTCRDSQTTSGLPDLNDVCGAHTPSTTTSNIFIENQHEQGGEHTNSYANDVLIQSLLILATKLRHSLTYAATQDVAQLLYVMSGSPMKQSTKYHWKKIIDVFSTHMTVHHLCPECKSYVGMTSDQTLRCISCDTDIDVKTNLNSHHTFITLSLAQQLKEIFEITDAHNQCQRKRQKLCEYGIEDINDGKLYKQKVDSGMISLNCSVDGAPIFNSSNTSIYPVLCSINELEPKERRSNILLYALWFGESKPIMNEYLKPFVAECQSLYTEGFSYELKGTMYRKMCSLLMCISDSVARPLLRNTHQFNGEYGCGLCLHPGETIAKGRGFVRVYPLDQNNKPFGEGLRTHAETIEHAQNKMKGVKGESILCDVPGFDIIRSLDVDWMHCVLLGICRQFCTLWFGSANHEKYFYFRHLEESIDEYLLSYLPTLEVSRTPRKISDRSHWKAHEWAIFLLFYSPLILRVHFPTNLVKHWALLVDGVSILLQTSIMPSEVEFSRKCLIEFIHGVEELYGREHVSFNVHLLAHLSDSVLNWGPLWTHSAFPYENSNQELLDYVKSSNGVALQICDTFRLKCVVDRLEHACSVWMTEDQKYYLDNLLRKQKRAQPTLILKDASMLGAASFLYELPRDKYLAVQRIRIKIDEQSIIHTYKRAIVNNEIFHSTQYSRVEKRASYYAILQSLEIFEIDTFLVIRIDDNLTPFALGRYFEKENIPLIAGRRLKHLIVLKKRDDNLAAINISQIKEKVNVFKISGTSNFLACVHPNHYELLT